MRNYVNTTTLQVVSLDTIRAAFPNMSIPEGADLQDLGYAPLLATAMPVAPAGFKFVAGTPAFSDGAWRATWDQVELSPEDLAAARAMCWARIKVERDRRKGLGVKVGQHWFHSDPDSRIQQLGITSETLVLPPGVLWKTLTFSDPPVFVEMTRDLAIQIAQATVASDTAIFGAAELHRIAMQASPDPAAYDFTAGWPASIEDEAHEAGIQFDARSLL